jgi:triosephosphate isomerase
VTHRQPLVAGNWKLHKTVSQSVAFARELKSKLASALDAEVAVAPVFTSLHAVKEALSGSKIHLAAQNAFWEDQGAFTGEVSALLVADVGCRYCIVGHSERRQYFGETDEMVKKRVHALFAHDVTPIVCVGETLEEREAKRALDVTLGQVTRGLEGVTEAHAKSLVIAYEPVWAIGTGRTAQPGDAEEMHASIRMRLGELFGSAIADGIRILYGGSVKPDNAKALMAEPNIDGALVGGASLTADAFVPIVLAASAR